MSKIPFKRILPALAALCLFFCCSSPVFARMPQQEPTPAEPQQPTTVPTLPAELYSQTATPGLDGGIRHTVLDGQFLITIAEMYGITLNDLLTLNNLTVDSIILPGDILIIREGGEITLGEPTGTPDAPAQLLTPDASQTPTSTLALVLAELTPEPTPTENPGVIARIMGSDAKFLALGVLGLVVFGVVLLIISSRRIQ
ncbi:MAG: LysM peptidoglycan-binding domain-containing protein [Anaerolineaceae bacterium]|jgi:LysM repeat protein|nr:LysM peptidoglycan-binding domain-containing protein [Anaerolineaceae bacterium]